MNYLSCGTVYHERCMQVELSAGSNPRFDRDRRSYEASMKQSEYGDGLLSAMANQEEVSF